MSAPTQATASQLSDVICYVEHAYYGCDTGCCGHAVVVVDRLGTELERHFEFDHPTDDADPEQWAREFAAREAPHARFDPFKCQVRTAVAC